MGYMVSLAIAKGLDSPDALHNLDSSIPWRAFALPSSDLTLIEWLHRPNPNNPPPNHIKFPAVPEFVGRPVGVSFPSDFGDKVPGLDQLYAELLIEKRANNLPKVTVHISLKLNELTGCRVLSIISDDDGWDFACEADDGHIERIHFDAGDDEYLLFERSRKLVRLQHDRECKVLHEIAESEAVAWDSRLKVLFGFDGYSESLKLVEVARVANVGASVRIAAKPKPRPLWKFW